jgi:hypothetical protein
MSKFVAYLCIGSIFAGFAAAFLALANSDYSMWGVGVLIAADAVLMLS